MCSGGSRRKSNCLHTMAQPRERGSVHRGSRSPPPPRLAASVHMPRPSTRRSMGTSRSVTPSAARVRRASGVAHWRSGPPASSWPGIAQCTSAPARGMLGQSRGFGLPKPRYPTAVALTSYGWLARPSPVLVPTRTGVAHTDACASVPRSSTPAPACSAMASMPSAAAAPTSQLLLRAATEGLVCRTAIGTRGSPSSSALGVERWQALLAWRTLPSDSLSVAPRFCESEKLATGPARRFLAQGSHCRPERWPQLEAVRCSRYFLRRARGWRLQ
mmetsp:Transcript_1058/g.4071  ORF Transcript_1058/g.4071 Transcript_1058/m.4071 type:complete len:273 (+) Transcript_1058:400-1218(+)